MTFWDFCCYCVIFFRVQNFHLLGDVKAKKEATSCRLNIEERTSLLTRLLLYNMDFLRRRRRRVKGKMYTENHGVCLSVRAFISGTPWRIWYWNFACIIYMCCDFLKKSEKKSFCLFVCLFYLWKRKKNFIAQRKIKLVTWRGTEEAALKAPHFWIPLQFGVGQQLIFVDDFSHYSNLLLMLVLWYSKTNFPFGGASLPFWIQAYLQW